MEHQVVQVQADWRGLRVHQVQVVLMVLRVVQERQESLVLQEHQEQMGLQGLQVPLVLVELQEVQ